jgi:hypothetical protein
MILRGFGGSSGTKPFTIAQDRAQLAIKKAIRAGDKAKGLEEAMTHILPWIEQGTIKERLDAETLYEGYNTELTTIKEKSRESNRSKGEYELALNSMYKVDQDDAMRSPAAVINEITSDFDFISGRLRDEINFKTEKGDDATALQLLLDEHSSTVESLRAMQRDVLGGSVKLDVNGKPTMLDGFGFLVEPDPIDGSIVSTSLLPQSKLAGKGRTSVSVPLGSSAAIPVYGTIKQDQQTKYVQLGDARFYPPKSVFSSNTDVSGKIFSPSTENTVKFSEEPGAFSLTPELFKKRERGLKPRQIVYANLGVDEETGQPLRSYLYQNEDGKVFKMNKEKVDALVKDPAFTYAMNGGDGGGLSRQSLVSSLVNISPDDFEVHSKNAEELFSAANFDEGLMARRKAIPERVLRATTENPPQGAEAPEKTVFFGQKNRSVGIKESKSGTTEGVMERAKSFFRKAA